MSNEPKLVQCSEPIETSNLHFKSLSKLKIFTSNEKPFDGRTNLLAVSQHYGLVFVGTINGFLVLKSKNVFSTFNLNECHHKEIPLNSQPMHLAVDFSQKHLAVGCQTKVGSIVFIYSICTFTTKGVCPIKTVPLSKPFQNSVTQLCELIWQPNADSNLTACFSDGSVASLSLFQGTGNEIFSLPNTIQARCLCWSPKGKQIVIGCSDGTLSQYKPDLKLVKKLVAPSLFNGCVTVVNVLWISSFQFAAAYKDRNKIEEFPVIVIVNAPKNEPIHFINYDDITYSTLFYRSHQLYLHHLSAWNLIFLASANSMEVAVLHGKEDNLSWEQWLLGDASRAELPLNDNKTETFPLGLAIDNTNDQNIPWGEDYLPPMPRLMLLSSEGLLITFNIINTLPNAPQLCTPPKEDFDDSWFRPNFQNVVSSELNNLNQSQENILQTHKNAVQHSKTAQGLGSGTTFVPLDSSSSSSVTQSKLSVSPGTTTWKVHPVKQQEAISPSQKQIQDHQQNTLQYSQTLQANKMPSFSVLNFSSPQPVKPSLSLPFKSDNTVNQSSFGCSKTNNEQQSPVSQNIIREHQENVKTSEMEKPAGFPAAKENTDVKTFLNQNMESNESGKAESEISAFAVPNADPNKMAASEVAPDTKTVMIKASELSPSRSTPELAVVDESVYEAALMDEIDHFNSELKSITSRVSDLKVQIGTEKEKSHLRNLTKTLNEFGEELNTITSSQKNEIHLLKSDVIEAFVWLEDAKSRNRQQKSKTYVQLKKSEELDPISNKLTSEINHLKYYIESQLKQLYSYLNKEWMEHQDNCRVDVKNLMVIPSMEDLYKTMHLQLKILIKQRLIIEDLKKSVENRKVKSQIAILTNSVGNNSKSMDTNRASELSKLADNLLQIKIDRDEPIADICSTDVLKLIVKNQMDAIAERSKKFTIEKQNILREYFSEREMIKTRPANKNYGSSSFIRNSLSRALAKKNEIEKVSKAAKNDCKTAINIKNSNNFHKSEVQEKGQSSILSKTLFNPGKNQDDILKQKDTSKSQPWNSSPSFGSQEVSDVSLIFNFPVSSSTSETESSLENHNLCVSMSSENHLQKNDSNSVVSECKKETSASFNAGAINTTGISSANTQKPVILVPASAASAESHSLNVFCKNTSSFTTSGTNLLSSKTSEASSFTMSATTFSNVVSPSNSSVFSPATQNQSTNSTSMFGGSISVSAPKVELFLTSSSLKTTNTFSTPTTASVFSFTSTITSVSTSPNSSATQSSGVATAASTPSPFVFSSSFNAKKSTVNSSVDASPSTTFSFSIASAPAFKTTSSVSTEPTSSSSSFAKVLTKPTAVLAKSGSETKTTPSSSVSEQEQPTSSTVRDSSKITSITTTATNHNSTNVVSALEGKVSTSQQSQEVDKDGGAKSEQAEENKANSAAASPEDAVAVVPSAEPSNSQAVASADLSNASPATAQPAIFTQTFAAASSASTVLSSSFSAPPNTSAASLATPVSDSNEGGFGQSAQTVGTSSSIFSTPTNSLFSAPKAETTTFGLIGNMTSANSSNIFAQGTAAAATTAAAAATTTTAAATSTAATSSGNVFGQVNSSIISSSTFGQNQKDEVGQTANLFGQLMGSNLNSGSVFGTPTTTASGSIFGKTAFNSGGGGSGGNIFGNITTTVTTTSIFGTTTSNIFSQASSSSFGQNPASNSGSVFGKPAEGSSTFFGQNICSSFGSPTTAAPNQNRFDSSSGFNSKPVFGQSFFGTGNSQQNLFERPASSNIFGGTSTSTSTSTAFSFKFQSNTNSFANPQSGPFSAGQTTTVQSGFGAPPTFQKPLGGFGGSPVFGSGLATTATFGAPATFGSTQTFGSQASFGNPQKIFGSSQGTFGQNQVQAPNFETLAGQGADGFANLAQQNKNQAFGGNTFNPTTSFGTTSSFGGNSFCNWRG